MIFVFYLDEATLYNGNERFKPFRGRLAKLLLESFNIPVNVTYEKLATRLDLGQLHADNYLAMLQIVSDDAAIDFPTASHIFKEKLIPFNLHLLAVDGENPIFPGLYSYARLCLTGTLAGAAKLTSGETNIAINLFGGGCRARRSRAEGGCYINDSVIGCLHLLSKYPRVLYISMNPEHCDGVEEAFYTTSRVMTLSFHDEDCETGSDDDFGHGEGKGYAVNVPIPRSCSSDEHYVPLFSSIVETAVNVYNPGAIVFVPATAVLAGDRYCFFNLTLKGYMQCLDTILNLKRPTLILGGAGSNVPVSAKAWSALVAKCHGQDIVGKLIAPTCEAREYFAPEYMVTLRPMEQDPFHQDDFKFLDQLQERTLSRLRTLKEVVVVNEPVKDTPEVKAEPLPMSI